MTSDGSPWRSGSADFDDVGFSLVKRDIEVLMLAAQKLASDLAAAGLNQAQVQSIVSDMLIGRIPWPVAEGGTGATDAATARTNLGLGTLAVLSSPLGVVDGGTGATTLTGYVKGGGTTPLSASATIPWSDITGGPAATGYRYLSAYGAIGLGAPFNTVDAAYSSTAGVDTALLSGNTFTANASGIYTAVSSLNVNFSRNGNTAGNYQFTTNITAPYGSVSGWGAFPFLNITATGLTWITISMPIKAQAVWTGYLSAGQTLVFTHNGNGTPAADAGTTIYNYLNISGVIT